MADRTEVIELFEKEYEHRTEYSSQNEKPFCYIHSTRSKNLTLGVRSFLELRPFFEEEDLKDDITECTVCHEMVIRVRKKCSRLARVRAPIFDKEHFHLARERYALMTAVRLSYTSTAAHVGSGIKNESVLRVARLGKGNQPLVTVSSL